MERKIIGKYKFYKKTERKDRIFPLDLEIRG